MTAHHQNVVKCQNTMTVLTVKWRIFPQEGKMYEWVRCV